MRDLASNLHFKQAFPPVAAVTTNAVQTSTILDTLGFGGAILALVAGALAGGTSYTVAVTESNDPAMAGASAVAATDLVGTPALASFAAADANECRKIGYIGSKRYIQATVTPAANTSMILAGNWVQGAAPSAPTANPPQ
jgi:hypothetical protein